ncbi:preprotein translocase subunit YajC [Robiginitomaculum antarcticum]|uniref:preprotein translocase subunit YajC n=1 Tax=Robiginitomaculum antarcticum TaxID=437507 RepID=UPI000376BC22|nr:preprotein translocase subunit YajC [Robiginitomaculum antarcticum]
MFFPLMQAAPGGSGIVGNLILFVPLILIFYFLLWRPQQNRAKAHRGMIAGLSRGDTVVTSGGIVGKITKVDDNDVTVEISEGTRVKVVKQTIADVRGKPAPANDTGKKSKS